VKAQGRTHGTYPKSTSSTDWTHVGSSTAEGEGGHNTTHQPHTELTNVSPLKAASHFVVPECHSKFYCYYNGKHKNSTFIPLEIFPFLSFPGIHFSL